MKYFLLFFGLLFIHLKAFSQANSGPVEVTPVIEKKISQEVARSAMSLKTTLTNHKETALSIAFALDTFRIEKYLELYIDFDWSTAGMRQASFDAAAKYDSLLNKYYKKLLAVLNPADKAALVSAQKAWISFRDAEMKLVATISKDEYSGGGTLQQLINASEYLEIIRQRSIAIYQHYTRATELF